MVCCLRVTSLFTCLAGSALLLFKDLSQFVKAGQHQKLAKEDVEIHLIPMDPVALTLKVEQKVALTGLAGLAR